MEIEYHSIWTKSWERRSSLLQTHLLKPWRSESAFHPQDTTPNRRKEVYFCSWFGRFTMQDQAGFIGSMSSEAGGMADKECGAGSRRHGHI